MSYIIKSNKELSNPFMCYCIFRQFEKTTDENFVDQNETITSGYSFLMWLMGKGYITTDVADKLFMKMNQYAPFYSLAALYHNKNLFPKSAGSPVSERKFYVWLAEYMSSLDDTRKRLFKFAKKAYKTFDDDFEDSVEDVFKKFELNKYSLEGLSYREEWELLKNMSLEEADSYKKITIKISTEYTIETIKV